jgi:hypothetical protein
VVAPDQPSGCQPTDSCSEQGPEDSWASPMGLRSQQGLATCCLVNRSPWERGAVMSRGQRCRRRHTAGLEEQSSEERTPRAGLA